MTRLGPLLVLLVLPSALAERGEHHLGEHDHALQLTANGHLVGERRKPQTHPAADAEGDQEVPSAGASGLPHGVPMVTLALPGQAAQGFSLNAMNNSAHHTATIGRGPETGGTCRWFDCRSWRGKTRCNENYKCVCVDDQIPVDGRCVDPGSDRKGADGAGPTLRDIKLMSYNVYYENNNYRAIAGVIKNTVNPDIVNLQEAIGGIAPGVVKALNDMGGATWALANPWNADHYWCGLTVYRSDKWDLVMHKELGIKQDGDTRGLCGAQLKRKKDGVRLCVFGTHPVWRSGAEGRGDPQWAKDIIAKGKALMQECAASGAQSAFLCDCNTADTEPVRKQLEETTGKPWKTAWVDILDKIFIQKDSGAKKAMQSHGGKTVFPLGVKYRYCKRKCQQSRWGYSDHPPVAVDVTPP